MPHPRLVVTGATVGVRAQPLLVVCGTWVTCAHTAEHHNKSLDGRRLCCKGLVPRKKKMYRGNYGQLDGLNERRDVKRNAMRDIIFFILITNII